MLEQFATLAIKKLNVDQRLFNDAVGLSREKNILLVHALIRMQAADKNKILGLWSEIFQLKMVDLDQIEIAASILGIIPEAVARKERIVPVGKSGSYIVFAMENPNDLNKLTRIQAKTGFAPKGVIASEDALTEALDRYYRAGHNIDMTQYSSRKQQAVQKSDSRRITIAEDNKSEDGHIINLINTIIKACVVREASDIHIEPYESFLRIRLRVDGALHEIGRPPLDMHMPLVSRIKVMADLKIEEKRLPQDGNINIFIDQKQVDFRVNVLPVSHGEKVVLRMLDKSSLKIDMTALGFESDDLQKFQESIHDPNGIVLVTGPTGSGKTTTLYSALKELNTRYDNVVSAEDPVEYIIEGINQVHINPEIGLDFAEALRAFLRQDPDVIMVGEIRDKKTGEIAIKAALTGHLVLSTLHANSASDTVIRLQNMGLEAHNIIAALRCVTAQRLLRKICTKCKIPDESVKPDLLINLGVPAHLARASTVYKGKGCDHCIKTGYKGRDAVHEVMVLSEAMKDAIMRGASASKLRSIAIRENMRTLRQNALLKLMRGQTDLKEVLSMTAADNDVDEPAAGVDIDLDLVHPDLKSC